MTLKDAMLKAGYAESSSNQQSAAVGALRNNTRMREALEKVGFTEDFIAEKIVAGVKLLKAGKPQLGYLQTSAELLDACPSKKIDHTVGPPIGYGEIEDDKPKANNREEARRLADSR